MFVLFELTSLAALSLLLAGIPESLGLLGSGVGLVVLAVLIRKMIGRGQTERSNEKAVEKA